MLNVKTTTKNSNLKSSDLRVRSYHFSLAIIRFVAQLPTSRVCLVIIDQLVRAATSIGANIIEAKSSSSKRDFVRFYQIALKSANETEYWLCLFRDSGLVSYQKVEVLVSEIGEISNMLGSSLLTMKGKKSF